MKTPLGGRAALWLPAFELPLANDGFPEAKLHYSGR